MLARALSFVEVKDELHRVNELSRGKDDVAISVIAKTWILLA